MLPEWALSWITICWRMRDKVAWTSSYYQINLVGLQGKLDSIIGLGLSYCNRLGLVSCPALSLYKERHGAPSCTHNHTINLTQKATHRLDVKAITQKRARTNINRSSLCVTVEFCVCQSPSNIATSTLVASCRLWNTDRYIWCKPCTYLTLRLTLSPNKPTSPMSSIRCTQNDFHARGTFDANHAPILCRD
jgi:hypothetical protein